MAKTNGNTSTGKKRLDLALQGGGSHGAFTWGVLDRLLEHPDIEIAGISGTSAGAMNATVLAYGLMKGGKEGARALLQKFWRRNSEKGQLSPFRPSLMDNMFHPGEMDYSMSYNYFKMLTKVLSPKQLNPMNFNPLRDLLLEIVDFDELRACKATKLFLSATNVRTIRLKVFHLPEISVDAVLASACLPQLFHTVMIDGEAYWDGGFIGNPPIHPLIEHTDTNDILLVQINPINTGKVPHTANEIEDRLNEISFNSALMWEMRWIKQKLKMLETGVNKSGKLRMLYFHAISADEALSHLGYSSKLNTNWEFLMSLFYIGRRYAEQWIQDNLHKVGNESSIDIQREFL